MELCRQRILEYYNPPTLTNESLYLDQCLKDFTPYNYVIHFGFVIKVINTLVVFVSFYVRVWYGIQTYVYTYTKLTIKMTMIKLTMHKELFTSSNKRATTLFAKLQRICCSFSEAIKSTLYLLFICNHFNTKTYHHSSIYTVHELATLKHKVKTCKRIHFVYSPICTCKCLRKQIS